MRSLLINFELAENTWGVSSYAASTWTARAPWNEEHKLSTILKWTCVCYRDPVTVLLFMSDVCFLGGVIKH